jgi:CRP-like cAMP-binding protein
MTDHLIILKQADIFYQIAGEQLEKVAGLCQERIYQLGEVIFSEGSNSDELYVIAQGEVEIQLNPGLVSDQPQQDYLPVTTATLRRGQSFGEIALIDQGLRSASARAARYNTRLLVLPREKVTEYCQANPQFGYRLMYNLAADLALKMRNADLLIRQKLLNQGIAEKLP